MLDSPEFEIGSGRRHHSAVTQHVTTTDVKENMQYGACGVGRLSRRYSTGEMVKIKIKIKIKPAKSRIPQPGPLEQLAPPGYPPDAPWYQ